MTPFVLLALVLILAAVLLRASVWVHVGIVAFAVLVSAGLASLGGLERASPAWAVTALALGLLVPAGVPHRGHSRVAPRRKRSGTRVPAKSSGGGGFEGIEVPGFEILEKVGSGGMASVYRARRRSDGQVVALKVPMEQYVADAKFIRRFHREAELAQRLDHPNIVHTFDHGAHGVQHYMAMEFVDGRSLESFIEAGERDPELSVDVMKPVVEALQNIHSTGIIHRDIKPGNIMIVKGGVRSGRPRVAPEAVKLMDFGIAGGKVMSRLTMTGARVGTPVYMSPEQARGLKIDHRSDIYSLGLVLYELLTGQTAFKGGYEAIVHQQIFQTPSPPRQLDVNIPRTLDGLVMRMIAKDPDERPTLQEIQSVLASEEEWESSDEELPVRLVLAVSTRKGVLRILDPEGSLYGSMGDVGVGEGSFPAAPLAVATDEDGFLYAAVFEYRVGDDSDHRMIFKLTADGHEVTRFGRYGIEEGQFLYPVSLAVAPGGGDVYVLDGESLRVQRFSRDGEPRGTFGGRGRGQGAFEDPRSLTCGPDGKVYVLDYGNRQVQRFTPDGRYETRWAFRMGQDQDGMRLLDGVCVGRDGTLFLSDATAGRIRTVTASGRVGQSYAVEPLQGEPTEGLMDLGVDDDGTLFAGRRGGHLIRVYDTDGHHVRMIDTYAPLVQMVLDVRRPFHGA
ncbi:MAG: protein kinase [Trueperaceae bacterium]|nr:protein kinase [Trueperaceae bacterium]